MRAVPWSKSGRQGIRGRSGSRMLTGVTEVEAHYVGFDAKRLPSVLRAIIRDLRKDHPASVASASYRLWRFTGGFRCAAKGAGGDADVPRRGCVHDYKIIAFDGGEDDAEANGYIAIMMASSFDCRAHLDANGLHEAVIEA